jgi:hypothetical protein
VAGELCTLWHSAGRLQSTVGKFAAFDLDAEEYLSLLAGLAGCPETSFPPHPQVPDSACSKRAILVAQNQLFLGTCPVIRLTRHVEDWAGVQARKGAYPVRVSCLPLSRTERKGFGHQSRENIPLRVVCD